MSSSALVTRVNPIAASNWRRGRTWVSNGRGVVDAITVHVTEGTASSVRDWFNRTRPNPSAAHYMVPIADGVELFVDEDDTAYHAGQLDRPVAPLVIERHANGGYTPNSYAIGIEIEGDGHHDVTGSQRDRVVALMADICTRRPVPVNRRHIFRHQEVKAAKTCPGVISVDRLVADVAALMVGAAPITAAPPPVTTRAPVADDPATRPRVVWSDYFGGYLVVTRVVSDTEWYFTPLAAITSTLSEKRSEVALSIMPTGPGQ